MVLRNLLINAKVYFSLVKKDLKSTELGDAILTEKLESTSAGSNRVCLQLICTPFDHPTHSSAQNVVFSESQDCIQLVIGDRKLTLKEVAVIPRGCLGGE